LTGLYISSTSTFIILFTTFVFIFIQAIKSSDSYIINLFSLEISVLLIASETDLSKIGFYEIIIYNIYYIIGFADLADEKMKNYIYNNLDII